MARVRVQIRYIRDWVLDYSEPGALWIITDWAWYRWVASWHRHDLNPGFCRLHPSDVIIFCARHPQSLSETRDAWML